MKQHAVLLALSLFLSSAVAFTVELDFSTTGQGVFSDDSQLFSGSSQSTLSRQFDEDNRADLTVEAIADTDSNADFFVRELQYVGDYPLDGGTSVISLSAGRQTIEEIAGILTPLTLDGVVVGWKMPGLVIQGVATTTALLRPEESLLLTINDIVDAADDDRFFGPQRYVGGAIVVLPETVGTANIYAQYFAQIDGRGFTADDGDQLYNSHYLISGVIGPLAPRLFGSFFAIGNYGAAEVVGTGTDHYIGYGLFGQLRSFLAIPGRPTGTLSILFASGDRAGALSSSASGETTTLFAPGPYETPWSVADVPFANVLAGSVSGTFLPLDAALEPRIRRTQIIAGATVLYRPWDGDSGASGLDPNAGAGWYGTELSATLLLEPFIDLDISATGDIFLPVESGNGGVYPDGTRGSWKVTVEMTLSF